MGVQGFWIQDKQRQVCYVYWEEISHLWKKLYNFIPFVEEILGVEFALEPKIKEVAEKHVSDPNINEPFMADLKNSFDADRFSREAMSGYFIVMDNTRPMKFIKCYTTG